MCSNCLCSIRFVGKLDVSPSVVGYNYIEMTPEEYIHVETGDILGMMWRNGGVIDFDTVSCNHHDNTR